MTTKKYASDYTIDEVVWARMAREMGGSRLAGGGWHCELAGRLYAPELLTTGFGGRRGWGMPKSLHDLYDFCLRDRWTLWMTPAQMDKYGNTNITLVGDKATPTTALIGSRGLPDNTVHLEATHWWVPNHSKRLFVEKVDFISGVGYGPERAQGIVKMGAPKVVVSNLAVFDFETPDHRMRLQSVHPGITVQQVVESTGFELVIPARVPETEPPTEEEVRLL